MAATIEELENLKQEAISSSQTQSTTTTEVELEDYSQYQVDECEGIGEEEEELEVCPTCTPNPDAIVPNWKRLPVRTPVYTSPDDLTPLGTVSDGFKNERTCEYSIVALSDHEGTGGSDEILAERLEEVIEASIRGLLRYYDKVESEGEGGTVELLKAVATAPEYYIAPRYLLKMKILVVIPAQNFDQIPSAFDEDLRDEIEEASDDIVVSYEPGELHSLLLRTTQTFRVYNYYQAQFEKRDAGYIIFKDSGQYFDYNLQRELLRDFLKSLNDFLSKNNYTQVLPSIFGGTNQFRFSGKNVLGNIEFGFSPDYKLKYINLTEKGCVEKDQYNVEFMGLTANEPWTDQATMAYVANLKDIEADITAREPIPWEDFTIKYTLPEVTITYGYGQGPGTDSNEELTTLGCFVNSLELNSLGGKVFDDIISYVDILAETWNEHLCMTPDDLKELNEKFDNEEEILQVLEDTSLKTILPDESVWLKWEEIRSELRSGGLRIVGPNDILDFFWREVWDRTGLCGLVSLQQTAIECLLSGLTFEEALATIVKSAVSGLSIDHFGRLFVLLPTERQIELQEEVKRILSLENVAAPWEDGDAADYYGAGLIPDVEGSTSPDAGLQSFLVSNQNSVLGSVSLAVEEIMETYKETLLGQWESLADLEQVVEFLGKLPGSDLLFTFLQDPDCAIPALEDLPVLSWVKNNSRTGLCQTVEPVTFNLEQFNVFRNTFDRVGIDNFAFMAAAIREKLLELLVELMISIIDQAVQVIYEAVCQTIDAAGDLSLDITTGDAGLGNPDSLKNIVRDSFCGSGATDEEVQDTVDSLFGSSEDISSESLNEFVSDMSILLTSSEMSELFLGEASEVAVESILDMIESDHPQMKAMFSGKTSVKNFFKNLGTQLPSAVKSRLRSELQSLPQNQSASACSTKQQMENFKQLRIQILQSKDGTTEQQASDLYCEQVSDTSQQLEDLLSGLPEDFNVFGDGGCSDDEALLPRDPEVLAEGIAELTNSLLDTVKSAFDRDLVGRKGFLNMVLSDSYSLPWRRHKRKYNRRRIYTHYPTQFQDQYGDSPWWPFLGGLLGKLVHGYYPETIAKHLQDQYLKVDNFIASESSDQEPVLKFEEDASGMLVLQEAGTIQKARDIRLIYRDNKDGEGSGQYNYGFEIEYSNYVLGNEADDIYRVQIFDTNIELDDSDTEVAVESEVCDMIITGSLPESVYDELSLYDPVRDISVSPQSNVYSQIIARSITDSGFSVVAPEDVTLKYAAIQQKYLTLLAQDIYENDAAFEFGFSTASALVPNDLTYYDPITTEDFNVRANGDYFFEDTSKLTTYGEYYSSSAGGAYSMRQVKKAMEESGILGISSNPRVHFLDPATYGGRYAAPPIYIAPRDDTGWLGLAQAMVPELDGCDPRTPDLIDFSDIGSKVQDIYLSIPDDPRLDGDPDCIVEKPYFKILERIAAAGIEGSLMTMIRIYVTDAMLKGMPVFSKFKAIRNDVIDDVFVEYIICEMESGLKELGQKIRNPTSLLRGDDFFYSFLEQAVQVYRRKFQAGEVEPTSDIERAIKSIDEQLPFYEIPTKQTFKRDKNNGTTERRTFRRYKQDAINNFIRETERDAKTILKALIYEQFEFVSSKFSESLKGADLSPTVSSLDEYLFGEESDVKDVVPDSTTATSYTSEDFVFERYVRLTDRKGAPVEITGRAPNLKGIVNLNEWQAFIDNLGGTGFDTSKSLSQYFGDLIALEDTEGRIVGTQGSIGVSYGLRVCYVMDANSFAGDPQVAEENKAYDLPDVFLVPIADVEIDSLDKALSSVNIDDDYNFECLFEKLIQDPQYMLMFKYVLPLPRLLSLLAIYASRGFLPSIGQLLGENQGSGTWGTELKEIFQGVFDVNVSAVTSAEENPTNAGIVDPGEWDIEALKARGFTYYDWDQETFSKTKRAASVMFRAFWNFIDLPTFGLDQDFKFDIAKELRELMDFNLDGVPMKWAFRRRLADRPFDKDDNECE